MKTKLNEDQLQTIIDLFNKNYCSRKIAIIIGVNRSTIIRSYKQLNLDSKSKKTPCFIDKIEKNCKKCNVIKSIDQFRKRINENRSSYESYCLICEKEYIKNTNNINYYKNWYKRKKQREGNKLKLKKYDLEYRNLNKDILKEKRKKHIIRDQERLKIYNKLKRAENITIKLRGNISNSIKYGLKLTNNTKNKVSCVSKLPYSISELKDHLESQFEPWMTWNNYGTYRLKEWNDNDSSTWKWQIDHIIPHSTFKYTSMEDEDFRKCWALENLRPYSAKQNLIDGTTKTRHIKQ